MARTALGKRNNLVKLFLFLGAAILLTGCVSLQDPEASQEYRADLIGSAAEGQSFGQSFISRRPGLDAIQLWVSVEPGDEPSSTIIAELFHTPGESQPLSVLLVSSSEVAGGGPLQLSIPPQPGGSGQAYYLSLKTNGGRINVFGRNEDVYPQGQAYANGIPLEADAAFRLSYNYGPAAFVQDLKVGLGDLWLALPLAITLLLPGWLLLESSGLGRGMAGDEKIGLALGLSLAAIPLVMLWTSVARLPWSQGAVLAAAGFICIAAAWRIGAHLAGWRGLRGRNPAEASSPEPVRGLEASAGLDGQTGPKQIGSNHGPVENPAKASNPGPEHGLEASAGFVDGPELQPEDLGSDPQEYPAKASNPEARRGLEALAGLDGQPGPMLNGRDYDLVENPAKAANSFAPSPNDTNGGFNWISLALFGVFLFSLAVRLIMARDLAAPAWVDSVHHALITRLVLEQGGFPATYAPYLDLDAAGYHPGFHSLVATFHWLSGLDIPSSILLLGQVLNALSIFSVYLFTTTLVRSRTAGLIAAFIAGIFTPMPAYYTSWGRYTQLAGLLILPAALALTLQLLRSRPFKAAGVRIGLVAQPAAAWRAGESQWNEVWKYSLLAGAAVGGLLLTHYRVLAFLACLLAAVWVIQAAEWAVLSRRKTQSLEERTNASWGGSAWRSLAKSAGVLGLTAAVSIMLTLPWWPDTLKSFVLPKSSTWNAGGGQLFSDFTWSYLNSGFGEYTLVLAALGFLWGIIRRRSFVWILAVWVILLFALANPGAVGLPGGGLINNLSVEISLFLPIALLGGYFLADLVELSFARLASKWRSSFRTPICTAALCLAAFALGLIGARQLIPILNPITLLFREADRPAIAWIDEHLPDQATILVNPFTWGYGLYAGNDGGYWITPLTGRQTIPPPVLYGFDNRTDKILATNEIIQKAVENSSNPTALHSMMKNENIDYLFIGRRGGIFSPRSLQESGLFQIIYQKDGVWIFQAR